MESNLYPDTERNRLAVIVFSNTIPFISLSSANLLHLMPTIFGSIVVAPSVVKECSEGGK